MHGYAGIANTAPNLFYNCEGRAVFYTAAVGIVLDKEANTQRFFLGHDDDIRCLAMHPNRRLAATGQVASKDGPPCCVVWDTVTAEEVTRLSFHRVEGQSYNMVVAAAFSPCGTRLLVVTADVDHTVFVFEWQRRTCIFKSPGRRGDPPQIFGAAWNPFPRGNWSQKGGKTPAAGPYMFVTYGVKVRERREKQLTRQVRAH